jgi:hypothetical protein
MSATMPRLLLPDAITIALDANVLRRDPRLKSPHGQALRFQVAQLRVGVVVPLVAVEEAVNLFRRDLEKAVAVVRKAAKDVTKMGVNCPIDVDVLASTRSFETDVRTALAEVVAEVLPYPSTPHADLAQRAMQRRRPFDEEGRGYRDALLWESVLAYAKLHGQVVLISADGDLSQTSKDRRLHDDLVDDLLGQQLAGDTVSLQPSVEAFLNVYVKGVEQARAAIEQGFSDERLVASLTDSLNDVVLYRRLERWPIGAPQGVMEATVEGVEELSSMAIQTIRPAGDSRWEVTATAIASLLIEYDVWAADAFGMSQDQQRGLEWVNDRVVSYEESISVGLRFSGIWEEARTDLTNLEIDSMIDTEGEDLL